MGIEGGAVTARSCRWIFPRFWWTEGKCFGVGSLDVECSICEQKRLTEKLCCGHLPALLMLRLHRSWRMWEREVEEETAAPAAPETYYADP